MSSQAGLDVMAKRKISPPAKSNPGCPVHSPVTVLSKVPQILQRGCNLKDSARVRGMLLNVSYVTSEVVPVHKHHSKKA